ncbi:hypothetical protein Q2T41_20190 [Maribacter confluentis]|uniref:Phenylalanine-tRNA ligase class II N-terminal domain-containing protein n=1 Tax=Maribacter confluentis TaxID=1656093 RepID=A0ABT8RXD1_9FLAO|nr:hypothetical protein [Maribacter confluentis]MDO1514934.1 hypothetical protein [Maribacter confluentis]
MIDKIKEQITEVNAFTANSLKDVETFRIKYLGKKGILNDFFAEFKNVPNEQKKEFGQTINQLKQAATEKVDALKEALEHSGQDEKIFGDLTRPGNQLNLVRDILFLS